VKDIASHLLDGSFRRLSFQRDGYRPSFGPAIPGPSESLLDFLNRLNAEWETATARLSPKVLIELMEPADRELAALFQSLDPFGDAIFPVAWAGEEQSSRNWMDVARDYTEKWHHTQQIFEAAGRPSTIVERWLFHPCLDIFMRALPLTYRDVTSPDGTVVRVEITGDAGGEWWVERKNDSWRQVPVSSQPPAATVTLGQDVAWKVFTKRCDRAAILARFSDIQFRGDVELGGHVLDMVSVMA
jgi:hypothetical protein